MQTSSPNTIIKYIPEFLCYCRSIKLSEKTLENYERFLKKFIFWLKKNNKTELLPDKLSFHDISEYKKFLSENNLKDSTQNYYLIALRALLNYFLKNNIRAILPTDIELLKTKNEKNEIVLDLAQIKRLLSTKTTSLTELRDSAIIEVLIYSGLKVSKITKLNRDEYNQTLYSLKNRLPRLKKYLEARNDKETALFINHNKTGNGKQGRLTARTIQRIVKKRATMAKISTQINPEILRKSFVISLINDQEKIKIFRPYEHDKLYIKEYDIAPYNSLYQEIGDQLSPLSWYEIETHIQKEILWLKNNIFTMPENYRSESFLCISDDLLLRKIAILIVGKKIKASEILSLKYENFWITKKSSQKINRHGSDWHKNLMDIVCAYFKSKHYRIIIEPNLNHGRADLGIINNKNDKYPIYFEIGTVSLFKLWYNLSTMKEHIFVIIPSADKIIEFKT